MGRVRQVRGQKGGQAGPHTEGRAGVCVDRRAGWHVNGRKGGQAGKHREGLAGRYAYR